MGKHTFSLGMNQFGDLTGDEFAKFVGKGLKNATSVNRGEKFVKDSSILLPKAKGAKIC
jgi:hypothetical protein